MPLTSDHDCVAPATVSHSRRSTYQCPKVDREGGRERGVKKKVKMLKLTVSHLNQGNYSSE